MYHKISEVKPITRPNRRQIVRVWQRQKQAKGLAQRWITIVAWSVERASLARTIISSGTSSTVCYLAKYAIGSLQPTVFCPFTSTVFKVSPLPRASQNFLMLMLDVSNWCSWVLAKHDMNAINYNFKLRENWNPRGHLLASWRRGAGSNFR